MDDYAEVSDKRNSPLIVCSKLTDAIIQALGALEIKMYREKNLDLSAWIIGGAQLYREALERDCVDRMVLSEIDADIDGDVFFPDFDKDAFIEVSRVPVRDDALPYDIVTYERKIS